MLFVGDIEFLDPFLYEALRIRRVDAAKHGSRRGFDPGNFPDVFLRVDGLLCHARIMREPDVNSDSMTGACSPPLALAFAPSSGRQIRLACGSAIRVLR